MRRIPCYAERSRSWVFSLPFVTALVMVLPSCGGSSSSTPTPMPTPTPTPAPVSTVIEQGSESGVEALLLLFVPFTTNATGTLDVTVDWTFASNDLDIFLARGTAPCSLEDFNAGRCPWVASSESFTAKPERMSASNAAAGAYTLYIANFGLTEESISWQVVLTTSGVASSVSSANVARPVELRQKDGLTSMRTGR